MRAQKVIVITGTTRGLGREIALALHDEEYNTYDHERIYTIIGLNRRKDDSPFQTVLCDITNPQDIFCAIQAITFTYGSIDVLINNAGLITFKGFEEYTEKDFDDIMKVNVKGAFLMSQEVLKQMRVQEHGYIINIGSTRAITSAPNKAVYSMSKFALRSMTQSINIEYNKAGIYSTIICPGAIDKEGTDKTKVQYEDVIATVKYLLTVPISARVPEIILGGQL